MHRAISRCEKLDIPSTGKVRMMKHVVKGNVRWIEHRNPITRSVAPTSSSGSHVLDL